MGLFVPFLCFVSAFSSMQAIGSENDPLHESRQHAYWTGQITKAFFLSDRSIESPTTNREEMLNSLQRMFFNKDILSLRSFREKGNHQADLSHLTKNDLSAFDEALESLNPSSSATWSCTDFCLYLFCSRTTSSDDE